MPTLAATDRHLPMQVKSGREAVEAERTLAALVRLVREEGLIQVWARFPVKGIQQFCTRFSYFYIYAFLLNRCENENHNTMLAHTAIVSIRFPQRESLVSSASADARSVPFRLDSYIYVYKVSDP